MSHIATIGTEFPINNEGGIKVSIGLMALEDCPGITWEQPADDLIIARYKPIEGYQTRGNLRFIRNADHTWSMQCDPWCCDHEMDRVNKAFLKNYTNAGIMDYCKRKRFTISKKKTSATSTRIEAIAMW